MKNGEYKYDLENRLVEFSVSIIKLTSLLVKSFASEHLSKQIIRSSSSSALNYGEAQSAESHRDFIHKMKVCLKELRETYVNIKIMDGAELIKATPLLDKVKQENNELISIFVASIKTSKKKNNDMGYLN